MYNYGYSKFTEPDLFPHIGNERNTLDVTRIDIEGLRNQRVVLTVPINTKLRPFEDYTLVIRQPIPHAAQGLPLYVRAIADMDFFPDVSVGFGIKIDDNDDGHGSDRHAQKMHSKRMMNLLRAASTAKATATLRLSKNALKLKYSQSPLLLTAIRHSGKI